MSHLNVPSTLVQGGQQLWQKNREYGQNASGKSLGDFGALELRIDLV